MEIGEIITFLVWVIPFPGSKTGFWPLDKKEKYSVKVVFDMMSGTEKIIPVPVWIIHFLVFETCLRLCTLVGKYFVKEQERE